MEFEVTVDFSAGSAYARPHSDASLCALASKSSERTLSQILLLLVGHSAETGTEADQDLLGLFSAWKQSAALIADLEARIDLAEKAFDHLPPPSPREAAFVQAGDRPLGIFDIKAAEFCDRPWYGRTDFIERLKARPRKKDVRYEATPEIREQYNLPEDALALVLKEPWPEAQARADEIVTAVETYWRETDEAMAATGLRIAEDEWFKAVNQNIDLRRRIVTLQAQSAAGLLLKLQVAMGTIGDPDEWRKSLLESDSALSTVNALCVSFVLDVMRLAAATAPTPSPAS